MAAASTKLQNSRFTTENLAQVTILMALCLTYEGLALNKSKTFFLSDRKDLAEINDIGGIKRAEKLKYLGSTLSCDRKQLVRDAKAKCTKFMQYVKGKIQTQNINETAEAIRTHFSALAKTIKVLTEKGIFSMTDRAERVAQ